MYLGEKKHFQFMFSKVVGNDLSGPVTIEPEKISYAYNFTTKSIEITGWAIFSYSLNIWISIPVDDLLNNPINYMKLVALASLDFNDRYKAKEPLSEEVESFLFKRFKKTQGA